VNLAVRLSKTEPLQMSGWVQNKLKFSRVVDGWVGAHQIFGSLWHSLLKVSFKSTSMKPTAPSALKASKYKTSAQDKTQAKAIHPLKTKPTEAPRTTFYKARTRTAPTNKKKAGKKCKYKTHLKVSIPISVSSKEAYDVIQKEIFRILHGLWEVLLAINSKMSTSFRGKNPMQSRLSFSSKEATLAQLRNML
jgi:hypothetical protein